MSTTQDANEFAPRKLTFEAARMEQALFWSRKTAAERLAASTTLTRRMYSMRGIDLDDLQTDFTPRRVPLRKG